MSSDLGFTHTQASDPLPVDHDPLIPAVAPAVGSNAPSTHTHDGVALLGSRAHAYIPTPRWVDNEVWTKLNWTKFAMGLVGLAVLVLLAFRWGAIREGQIMIDITLASEDGVSTYIPLASVRQRNALVRLYRRRYVASGTTDRYQQL